MIINHNISAIDANRVLGLAQDSGARQMEKLASGLRITRAADDASGLAVSEKMRGQIRGLNQAERNIRDGISFIQTTEGYLQESQDVLHRLRELSVQSANGIYSQEDRMQIQVEVEQLVDELDRVASHAQFNGMNMLTGRFARESATGDVMQLHVGANMDQNEKMFVESMTAVALGVREAQGGADTISMSTAEGANRAIGVVDEALKTVSRQRADLGASQRRFELASEGVAVASENLQAAESQIRDANMASEVVKLTRDSILGQAGIAMLAQANLRSQSVLQLLG